MSCFLLDALQIKRMICCLSAKKLPEYVRKNLEEEGYGDGWGVGWWTILEVYLIRSVRDYIDCSLSWYFTFCLYEDLQEMHLIQTDSEVFVIAEIREFLIWMFLSFRVFILGQFSPALPCSSKNWVHNLFSNIRPRNTGLFWSQAPLIVEPDPVHTDGCADIRAERRHSTFCNHR